MIICKTEVIFSNRKWMYDLSLNIYQNRGIHIWGTVFLKSSGHPTLDHLSSLLEGKWQSIEMENTYEYYRAYGMGIISALLASKLQVE